MNLTLVKNALDNPMLVPAIIFIAAVIVLIRYRCRQ